MLAQDAAGGVAAGGDILGSETLERSNASNNSNDSVIERLERFEHPQLTSITQWTISYEL